VVKLKDINLRVKQIRVSSLKVFIDRCRNSRPTCPPVEEQPQASGAAGSDDVSANPPSMHKIIGVREGILLGGPEKFCPENNNLPWN